MVLDVAREAGCISCSAKETDGRTKSDLDLETGGGDLDGGENVGDLIIGCWIEMHVNLRGVLRLLEISEADSARLWEELLFCRRSDFDSSANSDVLTWSCWSCSVSLSNFDRMEDRELAVVCF